MAGEKEQKEQSRPLPEPPKEHPAGTVDALEERVVGESGEPDEVPEESRSFDQDLDAEDMSFGGGDEPTG